MFLTYRYRIKDATTAKYLAAHARAVNHVWNYCCEVQRHAVKWGRKWPTWYDLNNLCSGVSPLLNTRSDTVREVCRTFHVARAAKGRCPKWRSNRDSLGWVPFRADTVKIIGDAIIYCKRSYKIWMSRPIPGTVKCGSFSRDARGRWYVNILCKVDVSEATGAGEIGIDLGLKSLATLSDGTFIRNPRNTAKYAAKLATAQRARKRKRAAAIHAKISNSRMHNLHEHSACLVRRFKRIVVGNVNASGLAKTTMAKSVFDAGWSTFRNMLAYKAIRHGCEFAEVDEKFTTQLCSACGARGGPKGIAQLGIRQWACFSCGVVHDRDQNAAKNILAVGAECRPPVEGIAA